jgi:hypothetical protein
MYCRPQRRSVLFTAPRLSIGAIAFGAAGGFGASPAEVLALIEKPHLIAVLFVGAFAAIVVEQAVARMRRQAWSARNR